MFGEILEECARSLFRLALAVAVVSFGVGVGVAWLLCRLMS